MAGERIENITETTTGYKRKALFYINAKFDTASQKFVSRVSFLQRSLAANNFGSAEFLFFCRRGFSLDGWKSKDLWADNMKPLFSLSNKKPLTYLPWLKLSGSLPIYPSISNSTTTRISWDFNRRKHKVYASPARWTVFNESSNKTIERRYYQFCRDKVVIYN